MLTDEERAEVVDEVSVLLLKFLARRPSDIALAFVEVLGIVFMAHRDGTFPSEAMVHIRKSLQPFPGLEAHIDVLAEEAMRRADEREGNGGVSKSV